MQVSQKKLIIPLNRTSSILFTTGKEAFRVILRSLGNIVTFY
jgi:hypothetical protein